MGQEDDNVIVEKYYRKDGDLLLQETSTKRFESFTSFRTFLDKTGAIQSALFISSDGQESDTLYLKYHLEYGKKGKVRKRTIVNSNSDSYHIAEFNEEGQLMKEIHLTDGDTMSQTSATTVDSVWYSTKEDFLLHEVILEEIDLATDAHKIFTYQMDSTGRKSILMSLYRREYHSPNYPKMEVDSNCLSGDVERSYFFYVRD